MNSIVRFLATPPLVLAALFASPAALAVDSGDIVVVSLQGEVHFTVNGAERNVRAGGVLEPPATLRTGRDGSVELKQGATTVSVGPETLLELPALEKRGAPIDRILQPRGNAFYNIGKREGRKLRVETPYLVGVVKGTQFNIAAQDEVTTISLFEGLLEVSATDDSAVVDLKAGEIASRHRGAKQISIMKMEIGKTPDSDAALAPVVPGVDAGLLTTDVSGAAAVLDVAGADLDLVVDLGLDDANITPDIGNPGTATDAGTDAGNTNTVIDVGGLLDSLLRRPGR